MTDDDYKFIEDIYKVAKEIVTEMDWNETEYSILTNGGRRQEVNQIHFHLNSGKIIQCLEVPF